MANSKECQVSQEYKEDIKQVVIEEWLEQLANTVDPALSLLIETYLVQGEALIIMLADIIQDTIDDARAWVEDADSRGQLEIQAICGRKLWMCDGLIHTIMSVGEFHGAKVTKSIGPLVSLYLRTVRDNINPAADIDSPQDERADDDTDTACSGPTRSTHKASSKSTARRRRAGPR